MHRVLEQRARQGSAPALTRALHGLFAEFRLDPEHREIGRLSARDDERDRARRRQFAAEHWEPTDAVLKELGWEDPRPGRQAQRYSGGRERRRGQRVEWLLLDPLVGDGRLLRIRLNGWSSAALEAAYADLRRKPLPHQQDVRLHRRVVKRESGPARVVDVEVPMRVVLPESATPARRGRALAIFVKAVLERAG